MRAPGDRDFPSRKFDALDARQGLEIVDPVESARFELRTTGRVVPTEAETDPFAFPLDSAVTIRAGRSRFRNSRT